MVDTEPVPSPTDRRRKRTVISHSYPDLQALAHRHETQTDSSESREIERLPSPSSDHYNVLVEETDKITQKTCESVVYIEKTEHGDGNENKHKMNSVDTNNERKESHTQDTVQSTIPDIVYDETKPKRLANPKSLKLDITNEPTNTLHESIVYLISPDEPDSEVSPRRRRKPISSVRSESDIANSHRHHTEEIVRHKRSSPRHTPSRSPSPEIRQMHIKNNSPLTRRKRLEGDISPQDGTHSTEKTDSKYYPSTGQVKPSQHRYEQSPETARRKISSPVQRMIVKTGAAAAAANSKHRKSSSEARLGVSSHDIPVKVIVQPRRKISSDARLEHGFSQDRLILPVETTRKRKVSFDTSALINGTRVGPLNDEVLVAREQPEHIAEESPNAEQAYESEIDNTNVDENTIPQVIVTIDDDEGIEEADKDNANSDESSSGYSEEGEDGYASGCDNRGYVPSDDEYVQSNKNNPSPAIISHTMSPGIHKASTTSLPSNIGRSRLSNELTPPKSILKVRREDTESMASEDSVKSFKVRKDSIALFMDQNGSVAMQELRKEYSHRFRCFDKNDLKQVIIIC